ncbi:alpha/beta hydrolase [Listeria welshimeri]|uniref:alpha/beta hydrolase n=1 Tax=Listeria welshimeri TaxID=1643 RepID=UPI0016251F4E|nr:alpha/beta hydrolase [Listeria welshimeri]MBC1622620.1 alpha/beta hydrolase [Listeria welshimeri]MBC1683400.1 alpha/beta hydrolase [Listeria welshimeri]MBC1696718.1 alpha/beta hydrolase [Listeria welshimeri]MBC2344215.1 alpha/beta hydrolase [Listeria welshimeri]MBF2561485.1 alpha/beta hydrolase [Listeria welshimeri]
MNYKQALNYLKSNSNIEQEEGTEVIFKMAADTSRGDLDPFLLKDREKELEGTNATIEKMPQEIKMPDFSNLEVATAAALQMRATMGSDNIDLSNGVTTDHKIVQGDYGDIPVRIYRQEETTKLVPALIFYHGGGFVGGTPTVVENFCKGITEKLPAVVINVDYHLAPEFPAPAAPKDCFRVLEWVAENSAELGVDASKIGVSGDSAGGTLAAAVSYMDREAKTNYVGFQALLYPALTLTDEDNEKYQWDISKFSASDDTIPLVAPGIIGMNSSVELLRTVYVRDENPASPIYSPLSAADKSIYPPTLIASAEFDALRAFADIFAKELRTSGVKTKAIVYQGMCHAFIDKYGIFPQAEDVADEIVQMMKEVFK